ncbi:uncharacterized protein G2W53_020541 [Senna tora]|uniref:Uncharacterized protein n=1 Tax=Senna tora TaxID=362788 RepID=A0A834TY30_9FABA|nr:uncharacterized protein G2W53_020541 [Senna tora]
MTRPQAAAQPKNKIFFWTSDFTFLMASTTWSFTSGVTRTTILATAPPTMIILPVVLMICSPICSSLPSNAAASSSSEELEDYRMAVVGTCSTHATSMSEDIVDDNNKADSEEEGQVYCTEQSCD